MILTYKRCNINIFTVSFFGHRIIDNSIEIEKRLEKIVRRILNEKEYTEFLVGREGEFDILVSSVIRRVVRSCGYGNSSLILVMPYMKAEYRNNERSFHDYYDEIEICPQAEKSYFKSAIMTRNRDMVRRSDLVICCIEHEYGGAYTAVRYAGKQGVEVINIKVP